MKFSILIPAYKSRYLKECVDSVLNQSFEDFEVVIVDDNSPEDLGEIVECYSDDRIRYYKNETNCGAVHVVDNWNKCLFQAYGDYIICMGDDDMLASDCLMEYAKAIDAHPEVDVFHIRSYIIDENSQKFSITSSWPDYENVYENIWHRVFGQREHFIGDYLYKKSALIDKGGFYDLPCAWGSDDITSYIVSSEKGIVHINKPLFLYRRTDLTISSVGYVEEKLRAVKGEEDWLYSFVDSLISENDEHF